MNIKEISALCGVSTCTVSRVLSGDAKKYRISDATAKKILKVADKKGYRPNYLARSLNTRQTFTIGLIFANTVDFFLGRILEGVEAHLRGTDYQTIVATCENSSDLYDEEIQRMLYRHVDGVILYPLALAGGVKFSLPKTAGKSESDTPCVVIGRHSSLDRDEVMFCDREAGQTVAEGFLEGKRRRFAFLAPQGSCSADRGREAGYVETLKKNGIKTSAIATVRTGEKPTPKEISTLAKADAIFSTNSALLLSCLSELKEIRDLLSVKFASVGKVEAEDILPIDLRTLSVPARAMGTEAAKLLLWRMENPGEPLRRICLPLV